MSKNLYIVGNGFDLHHWNGKAPNTSYESFGLFLQKNETEIYDLFCKFFLLKGNWSNFEIALSELDIDGVWDDLSNYINDTTPERMGEAGWEAKKNVDLLTTEMRQALHRFIHGESYKNKGIEYPYNIDEIKLQLPQNALYLSFNYTNTLERYYGISAHRICYLHGKSGNGEELIIGHGVDPVALEQSEPSPAMPNNLSPEQQEMWQDNMNDQYSYSADQAEDEIGDYWRSSFKNTENIIDAHDDFFQACEALEQITVMGHSLSEIDIPYFEEIKQKVSEDAFWNVSFHDDGEKDYLKNTLLGLGIPDDQIKFFQLEDLALCSD